jgi:hypothetical protein
MASAPLPVIARTPLPVIALEPLPVIASVWLEALDSAIDNDGSTARRADTHAPLSTAFRLFESLIFSLS